MTSQDGMGAHETTTGHRRRSLYEELGASLDLFDDNDPKQPQGSNGTKASSRRSRVNEIDETESFIAALREDPPPARASRGEHAARPNSSGPPSPKDPPSAAAPPSAMAPLSASAPPRAAARPSPEAPPTAVTTPRPAFEDGPQNFTPPAGWVPDDPSGAYNSGDLPVPGFARARHDPVPAQVDSLEPAHADSPISDRSTDSQPGEAYSGGYELEPYAGSPPESHDLPEQRASEWSIVESLLPVDALAPVDRPSDGKIEQPKSADLTADSVLRRRQEQPGRGWRRTVFALSGGALNPGPSAAERRERELINRARTPLRGCHRLAIISLKGGVGKTTTTACLGSMFATLRGDRVIAMDANPDRGTLGEKIPRTSSKTVRDLVNNAHQLTRYADVREFTSQAPSRLEVLASESDPFVSMAFSETDYRVGVGILASFYNLILTDCGTGLLHGAMVGVLGLADSLIVVSSPSLDGARSASATLDWLERHGYDELVGRSVAVISTVHPAGGNVDVSKLEEHFASRCRAVVRIPFDPHLEEGGIIDLDELKQPTYDAYLQLAAEVGDGFALPPRIG